VQKYDFQGDTQSTKAGNAHEQQKIVTRVGQEGLEEEELRMIYR